MKHKKFRIACVIAGFGLLVLAISNFTDKRSPDEVRYDELSSARLSEARFMQWRTKPWYGFLSRLTRFEPVNHYRSKADDLERSLQKSGALIWVGFYPPSFLELSVTNAYAGRLLISPQRLPYFAQIQDSGAQFVNRSLDSKDGIFLLCRPRDVGYWQFAFCTVTNRVRWGTLRKLGGNRDNALCQLPDGQFVELGDCQKWLNESIATGWMVGVCSSNGLLTASRRKPAIETN